MFQDISLSDIEHVQSKMKTFEYQSIGINDPTPDDENYFYIPFWTQMVRLNQTHFHNNTSIFHQDMMFRMPDFSDQVISNLNGKLRLVQSE